MIEFFAPRIHVPGATLPSSPLNICSVLFNYAISLIWGAEADLNTPSAFDREACHIDSSESKISRPLFITDNVAAENVKHTLKPAKQDKVRMAEPDSHTDDSLVDSGTRSSRFVLDSHESVEALSPGDSELNSTSVNDVLAELPTGLATLRLKESTVPQEGQKGETDSIKDTDTHNSNSKPPSNNKKRKPSRRRRNQLAAMAQKKEVAPSASAYNVKLCRFEAEKSNSVRSKKTDLTFARDLSQLSLSEAAAVHMSDRLEVTKILLEGLANASAANEIPGADSKHRIVGSNSHFVKGMYSAQGYYGPDARQHFQRAHCSFIPKILFDKGGGKSDQLLILRGEIIADGQKFDLEELLNVVHLADERINLADNLLENLVREPLLSIIEHVRCGKLGGAEAFAQFQAKVEKTLLQLTDIRSQLSLAHDLATRQQRMQKMSLRGKGFQQASHEALNPNDKDRILSAMLRVVNPKIPKIHAALENETNTIHSNRRGRKQKITFSLTSR